MFPKKAWNKKTIKKNCFPIFDFVIKKIRKKIGTWKKISEINFKKHIKIIYWFLIYILFSIVFSFFSFFISIFYFTFSFGTKSYIKEIMLIKMTRYCPCLQNFHVFENYTCNHILKFIYFNFLSKNIWFEFFFSVFKRWRWLFPIYVFNTLLTKYLYWHDF